MTTNVKIHVNGRYKATITRNDEEPIVVHGNYEGSPNPSGDYTFNTRHDEVTAFVISEEDIPDPAALKADLTDS